MFVVGVAKAGTTSLYYYLKQHPEIYLSPIKETHYFSTDIKVEEFSKLYKTHTFLDLESYFSKRPLEELALSFVRKEEHYKALFEDRKEEKIVGECSPSYLNSETALKNIYKYNPEAKIIVSLRNPISRSFSHYLMALRLGHTKDPFRIAFEKDRNAPNKGWGKTELFYDLSMYAEQLKRLYAIFPKEQIKVVLFEDLISRTAETMQECFSFLNLSPIQINQTEAHNVASVPKNRAFNHFIVKTGIKKTTAKLIGKKIKRKAGDLLYQKNKQIKITQEDKAFLRKLYAEDIKKTAKIIQKDLSGWLKE